MSSWPLRRSPAVSETRPAAATFYAVAYAVPSLAVMLIAAEEGVTIGSFGQLATRRPVIAWSVVLFLLSLIGIPPLVGFFGKLYVFGSAISGDLAWLAVLGVITSVVSAAYYFRIVRAMFFGDATSEAESTDAPAVEAMPAEGVPTSGVRSIPAGIAIGACAVATVALGVFARIPMS